MNEVTTSFPRREVQEAMPVSTSMVTHEAVKAAQEVQAAIIMAKRERRCQFTADQNIMTACKRLSLAESGLYSYPRGGQQITGPSIRLAEVMAQCWGNLDFGIRELEQRDGESKVEAYCWDLETNVRQTKIFTVKHERVARGDKRPLTDPRDIYELVANNGARRLRACILGIIPGDLVEKAVNQCNQTMEKGDGVAPLKDRISAMIKAFADQGVTIEMIETRLGHKIDVTIPTELVSLQKIFISLRDGMSQRKDWFKFGVEEEAKESAKVADLNKKFVVKPEEKIKN